MGVLHTYETKEEKDAFTLKSSHSANLRIFLL